MRHNSGTSKKNSSPLSSIQEELAPIIHLEREIRNVPDPRALRQHLIVSIQRGDSLAIGNTIVEVDREIRRTMRLFSQGGLTVETVSEGLELTSRLHTASDPSYLYSTHEDSPSYDRERSRNKKTNIRPLDASVDATRLVDFRPGSGHMLFEILNNAIDMFSNQPLSALLNFVALSQGARWVGIRVLVFRNQKVDRSLDEVLESAALNGGSLEPILGPPEQVGEIGIPTGPGKLASRTSYVDETMNDQGVVIARRTTTIEVYT